MLTDAPDDAYRAWQEAALSEGLFVQDFTLLTPTNIYLGRIAVPPLDRGRVPPFLWTRSCDDAWRSSLPPGARTFLPTLEKARAPAPDAADAFRELLKVPWAEAADIARSAREARDAAGIPTSPADAERAWLAQALSEGLIVRALSLFTPDDVYLGWVAARPRDRKRLPLHLRARSVDSDLRPALPEGSRTYFPALEKR